MIPEIASNLKLRHLYALLQTSYDLYTVLHVSFIIILIVSVEILIISYYVGMGCRKRLHSCNSGASNSIKEKDFYIWSEELDSSLGCIQRTFNLCLAITGYGSGSVASSFFYTHYHITHHYSGQQRSFSHGGAPFQEWS